MGWASMMEDFDKMRNYNSGFYHPSFKYEITYIEHAAKYVIASASDPERVRIYNSIHGNTGGFDAQAQTPMELARSEREASIAMQRDLYTILDSLRLKQKLLNDAYTLHSFYTRLIIEGFMDELQSSMSIVNEALDSLHFLAMRTKSTIQTADRLSAKKMLIYQLVQKMQELINNSDMIPIKNIKEISKDISGLVAWYYDDQYIFCNVGALSSSENMVMKYLKEEMQYTDKSCEICNEPTVAELDYCINCGCCIRGEKDD